MTIRIENVSKAFGATRVLSPLDITINDGEMLALLGPSGSGKTTLLRMIAGLERCDHGRIFFGKRDVTHTHVRDRHIGFVFQHYALFEHMTIADNIAFGLSVMPKAIRPSKRDIARKVSELLAMIQLPELAKRYPSQLSGGQKQRVALARALATEPDILLLDEPFGALDALVRKDLRHWLRTLHEQLKFTSVFVTHDQEEAFEVADRVAILNQGRIEQIDTPTALFAQPKSRFVFDFLGHVNAFSGECIGNQLVHNEVFIELPDSTNETSDAPLSDSKIQRRQACLYFRSHEIEPTRRPHPSNNLAFTVASIAPVGAEVRVQLEASNWQSPMWEITLSHGEQSQIQLQKGDACYLKPRHGHLFTNESGDAEHSEPHNVEWPALKSAAHLSVVN